MTLEPGTELLHYRLVEKIGEGGMGVVWNATDTKLDREVAVKFLPHFSGDSGERLLRFEREAKLLASLNHANIASIFGLHEVPGDDPAGPALHFLAMELVPGEDLSKALARGPLPAEQALEIARQVAEALETAHANGIIHRDLKPANIQLTPDGKVKVLDFGLAKAFEIDGADSSSGASSTMSPTLTSAGTIPGMILGTAAYMSPEQARGHNADKRSDVWAFGCVLYEMLAGRAPFRGDTVSDTLASVLKSDPAWDALSGSVQRRIRTLLGRCLQKDPRKRLHDVADARIVIEEAQSGVPDEAEIAPAASRLKERLVWAALLGATLITAIVFATTRSITEAPRQSRRIALAIEEFESDYYSPPTISPAGDRIVYVADEQLWVLDLGEFEPRAIDGTEGAQHPFWSPDGEWIGYGAGGRLWRAPVAGGKPVFICDLSSTTNAGTWLADDTIVVAPSSGSLLQVPVRGGELEVFVEVDTSKESDFHKPHALPDGQGVVFSVHRTEGIDTLGAAGPDRERKVLLTVEGATLEHPVYSAATGHLLWARGNNNQGIWAASFSPERLELTGEPFLVAPGANRPSVAGDGTLIYVRGASTRTRQVAFVDYFGNVLEKVGDPLDNVTMLFPSLSPDGTQVAVNQIEDENNDIWIYDLAHETRTRYTFEDWMEVNSGFTPDGSGLLYSSGETTFATSMFLGTLDRTGEPRSLGDGLGPNLSPDGKHLLYLLFNEATGADLWTKEMEVEGAEPRPFLQTEANESYQAFSPNGRFVAYCSDESGEMRVYLRPFPEGRGKWQISDGKGTWPRFSPDGKRLFYSANGSMWSVEIDLSGSPVIGRPEEMFNGREKKILLANLRSFDAVDGERLLVVLMIGDDDQLAKLVLAEGWSAETE